MGRLGRDLRRVGRQVCPNCAKRREGKRERRAGPTGRGHPAPAEGSRATKETIPTPGQGRTQRGGGAVPEDEVLGKRNKTYYPCHNPGGPSPPVGTHFERDRSDGDPTPSTAEGVPCLNFRAPPVGVGETWGVRGPSGTDTPPSGYKLRSLQYYLCRPSWGLGSVSPHTTTKY